MQHLPLSLSKRCLSSLQAVNLLAVICPRMRAIGAWKDAAAFISRLDPTRFGHVEQVVGRQCAGLDSGPMDYLAALGWDGYGFLIPRASFDTEVRSHAAHLGVRVDPRVLKCISLHPSGFCADSALNAVLP